MKFAPTKFHALIISQYKHPSHFINILCALGIPTFPSINYTRTYIPQEIRWKYGCNYCKRNSDVCASFVYDIHTVKQTPVLTNPAWNGATLQRHHVLQDQLKSHKCIFSSGDAVPVKLDLIVVLNN